MEIKEKRIEPKDTEIKEGLFFAIVAYLSFLCLVPLILKKDNKFAVHHGKQGLILFIAELAAGIIAAIPFIGWIIGSIALVVFGIASLIGIIQVIMGNYWKIPVVYNIAKKITLP